MNVISTTKMAQQQLDEKNCQPIPSEEEEYEETVVAVQPAPIIPKPVVVVQDDKTTTQKKKKPMPKKTVQPKRAGSSSSSTTTTNTNGIRMKKVVKQVGKRYFCYTESDRELFILSKGNVMRCVVTCFDNLAIFNVCKEDRQVINEKLQQMATNAGFIGTIQYINVSDEDEENDQRSRTLFVKSDNHTQYFNVDGSKMNGSLPTCAMNAKICIRFMGVLQVDQTIKPMLRLYQLKLEASDEEMLIPKIHNEPCLFNL